MDRVRRNPTVKFESEDIAIIDWGDNPRCPRCQSFVARFLPVNFLNGDTLWQCKSCGKKFKTDKDGATKE